MISKKFIRNSIIYTIAGSLPMASAIILLPFYTDYLSTSVYGAMILYTSFSLLVQVLVTYSFDTSVYNYYHDFKNDEDKLSRFISSVFLYILIISIITALVLALVGGWLFENVFTESKITFYPYGLMSTLTGVFMSLSRVNGSLLQTRERAGSFFWYNLLTFSLIAVFTIGGLRFFPDSLIGPVGGRMLAFAIAGGWALTSIFRRFGTRFDFDLIKSTLGFNHPSWIYQIMQWINNYFDRFLLSFYMPLSQLGIYDLAVKCLTAIELVIGGLNGTIYPKVLGMVALQTEKKSTIEINRYYNGLTAATILLVSLSIFFLPIIIKLFITKPGYLAALPWIPLIAVTYLLRAIRYYVVMPYAALKYQKPLPLYYLVITTIKIASMVILIPFYGISGVILVTWIGYVIEILILYLGIRNKFLLKANWFKMIVAPSLMAISIVFLESSFGADSPLIIHGIYVLLAMIILGWAYRNELKNLSIFRKLL